MNGTSDTAEREFYITMRRQTLGTIGALEKWHRATLRGSSDARFTQAFREALRGLVRAIEERYEVGEREPKERSLTG